MQLNINDEFSHAFLKLTTNDREHFHHSRFFVQCLMMCSASSTSGIVFMILQISSVKMRQCVSEITSGCWLFWFCDNQTKQRNMPKIAAQFYLIRTIKRYNKIIHINYLFIPNTIHRGQSQPNLGRTGYTTAIVQARGLFTWFLPVPDCIPFFFPVVDLWQ